MDQPYVRNKHRSLSLGTRKVTNTAISPSLRKTITLIIYACGLSQGKHSPVDAEMFDFMFSATRNLHCDNVHVKVCYLSQHGTHTHERNVLHTVLYYTQLFVFLTTWPTQNSKLNKATSASLCIHSNSLPFNQHKH